MLLYFLSVSIGFVLAVQLGMTLAANLVGNLAITFMEQTYTKNPKRLYEKLMNIVFYALYSIPHFFYTKLMLKLPYWKARVAFLIWSLFFVFLSLVLLVIYDLILDWLGINF
ncbi:hypothetical protein AB3N04_04670 [Alkalihalophilus sp. As8PL]|uniref:Uncharacterized protein n=1 Tax=Alkalihalophilus sp. As8PL TaxID=3237103 RepID=A0AB39BU95_9BACI